MHLSEYTALDRFAVLARSIAHEAPAVTSIVLENEYIDVNGSGNFHEVFDAVFFGIEDDSLLDGIKAVRRLEQEKKCLFDAIERDTERRHFAEFRHEDGAARICVRGDYPYTIDVVAPENGASSCESVKTIVRTCHILHCEPSGHERMAISRPISLEALLENPIHARGLALLKQCPEIISLPAETPVRVTLGRHEILDKAEVTIEIEVPVDIFHGRNTRSEEDFVS